MITAEKYLAACWYQPEEMPYPSCYCRRFRRHYEGSVRDTILTFDLQSDSVTIVGVNSQAYFYIVLDELLAIRSYFEQNMKQRCTTYIVDGAKALRNCGFFHLEKENGIQNKQEKESYAVIHGPKTLWKCEFNNRQQTVEFSSCCTNNAVTLQTEELGAICKRAEDLGWQLRRDVSAKVLAERPAADADTKRIINQTLQGWLTELSSAPDPIAWVRSHEHWALPMQRGNSSLGIDSEVEKDGYISAVISWYTPQQVLISITFADMGDIQKYIRGQAQLKIA